MVLKRDRGNYLLVSSSHDEEGLSFDNTVLPEEEEPKKAYLRVKTGSTTWVF